jgi:hypothetical protein
MPDNLTDPSLSTEQFRAFVQGTPGAPEPSWAMKAPRNKILLLAGIVVAVAIVIALLSLSLT